MPGLVQGLVGHGADFGFYSEGGGSPGGLWAEAGRDRTQVLTGDFWSLLGGQTMEDEGGSPGEERKLFREASALIPASSNGDRTRLETGGREMGRWADSGYVVKVEPTRAADAQMIEPSSFYKIVKNRVMRVESQQIKVLSSALSHCGTSPSLRVLICEMGS